MSFNKIDPQVIATETIIPVGTIIESVRATPPTNYLDCDGSALSRTLYADLFSVMPVSSGTVSTPIASPGIATWTAHGLTTGREIQFTTTGTLPTGINTPNRIYFVRVIDANTFHLYGNLAQAMNLTSTVGRIDFTGTNVATHTGTSYAYGNGTTDVITHFGLPDFRGVVPRGVGTTNGYIQSATVGLGEKTDDAFQGHRMSPLSGGAAGRFANAQGGAPVGGGGGYYNIDSLDATTGNPTTDGTNGTPRTTNETRVKSLGMKYFIKYQ